MRIKVALFQISNRSSIVNILKFELAKLQKKPVRAWHFGIDILTEQIIIQEHTTTVSYIIWGQNTKSKDFIETK